MTRIIVVSDSHGLKKELEDIYYLYKEETSFFIHCGDSTLSVNHPILKPYLCVSGNCDFSRFPKELFLHIGNNKILITHGHKQNIKYGFDVLYQYARYKEANIVLFGHTHYPIVYKYYDILFVNPGSILANRGIRGRTYAIIDIINNKINVKHIDLLTGKEFEGIPRIKK